MIFQKKDMLWYFQILADSQKTDNYYVIGITKKWQILKTYTILLSK